MATSMNDVQRRSHRPIIGNLFDECDSPDIGMCIEHGAYQGGARSWHATDENQRHVAVVRVPLVIEWAHHVFLENAHVSLKFKSASKCENQSFVGSNFFLFIYYVHISLQYFWFNVSKIRRKRILYFEKGCEFFI